MGTRRPAPKRARSPSPIFGPFLLWPNGWMHQDATWYGNRPQPSGLCVRWGPSYPPKKVAKPPIFAHFYCDQTTGCIKMPLGMEVGLSSSAFVLDGDPAPTQKGRSPPNFRPSSIVWPNCVNLRGWSLLTTLPRGRCEVLRSVWD